jgi:alpha-1,6-mannosyltransferase
MQATAAERMSLDFLSLRLRIHLLGATALLAYVAMALLSYLQAPVLWWSAIAGAPRAVAFFDELAQAIPVYASIREAISGPLTSNTAVIVSYWIPLAVATIAMMLLLLSLARLRESADAAVAGLLFRWSLAFAAACSFAFPLFTQDLWLSAVWGRMIVAGVNPYHNFFTPESLEGLPIDHFPMVMSYGPLWGLLSGAVMATAGDSVLTTAIVSKTLLAAAWIGSLALVRKIMEQRSALDRCLAVALLGWAPVSVTQSLAEGHNDIVMMFFALLWLSLLLRGRRTAPIALIASALCKYTTAPLLLIDAIYVLRIERAHWRSYLIRLIAPALLALLVFAVFYRSPQFFDGLLVISEWHFLQPRDAVSAIEYLTATSLSPLAFAVTALFPFLAIYFCFVCFRSPTIEGLLKGAIAILASICFAAVSHLWPWYMIWSLAFAVLLPAWWLSRFVVSVSVMAPFAVVWWISPLALDMSALVMYGAAILWMLCIRYASGGPASTAVSPGQERATAPR